LAKKEVISLTAEKIIEVKGLSAGYGKKNKLTRIVNDVSFSVHKGEILGIVGESGCGKSVTSLSMMGLNQQMTVTGQVLFGNQNLLTLKEKEWRKIRGNEFSMIFQEPMTSLNPLFTIGDQLTESVIIHKKFSKKAARQKAIEMMEIVGLPRPGQLLKQYPHELSGGMRQRIMIAMALMCDPKILIADEPTTALDVTIQAQILTLLKKMNEQLGTAIMLITHDLGVVLNVCQRVVIMYAGRIVEQGNVKTIFKHPKHPYTQGLFQSIPRLESKQTKLYSIKGSVPKPGTITKGCTFAPRCPLSFDRCFQAEPPLYQADTGQLARCYLAEEGGEKLEKRIAEGTTS
jgi:peptide/nickel transport system ATP-binding protein